MTVLPEGANMSPSGQITVCNAISERLGVGNVVQSAYIIGGDIHGMALRCRPGQPWSRGARVRAAASTAPAVVEAKPQKAVTRPLLSPSRRKLGPNRCDPCMLDERSGQQHACHAGWSHYWCVLGLLQLVMGGCFRPAGAAPAAWGAFEGQGGANGGQRC